MGGWRGKEKYNGEGGAGWQGLMAGECGRVMWQEIVERGQGLVASVWQGMTERGEDVEADSGENNNTGERGGVGGGNMARNERRMPKACQGKGA